MVNMLPAIIIGGPPHAGKSTLTYNLTRALRQRRVDHFVIRACPDYEGDWTQEIDQRSVDRIRFKGEWTPEVVQHICTSLQNRHFPLLVDLGGRPKEWQTVILRHCTHSILLLKPGDEATIQFWRNLVIAHGLQPIADLYSELEGISTINETAPVIRGTLTGLERDTLLEDNTLFNILVDRVADLFTSFSSEDLRQKHFDAAPAQLIDVDDYVESKDPKTLRWKPEWIEGFLTTVPRNTSIAIYGHGTPWLYGSLALLSGSQPFYQFDGRLGWVTPPSLQIGTEHVPAINIHVDTREGVTVLTVRPLNDHLEYDIVSSVPFPPVPKDRGLIFNGRMPLWLVTALVRLYDSLVVPWIACYEPRMDGAIIVTSRVPTHTIGQLVPVTLPEEPRLSQ
ncbi:MAG TPA: CRISPR-associated protein Csx3 [Ktedonobacteraceae bacterium]|jgi:CRISPR-associated protein Csx3|nr:CRISPR-associated protein Csx3 [Ktedonobacteraceae bacterium]